MGKHHHPTAEDPPAGAGEAVSCNLGGAYWSVDDCAWSSLRPGLPDNLVDLLAPPIVVGAVPVVGVARPPASALATPPTAGVTVVAGRSAGASVVAGGSAGAPLMVPSTPPTVRTRNTGTRRPPGRHRRGAPAS